MATFLPCFLAAQVMDDGFHAFHAFFAFGVDLAVWCGRLKFQSCNILVPVRYQQWGLVCR